MRTCRTCQKTYPDDFSLCPHDGAPLTAQAMETEAQLAAEWDEEIARRVAEIKAGAAATCSLDDLTSDLRSIVDR